MKGNSPKTTQQVKVCHFCGDKGFSNALIDCSKCPNTFAHQYCMGIPPGSIDSSFTWVCNDCCEPDERQPSISTVADDVSTKSSEETCHVSIDVIDTKPEMKAITSLCSESCTHKGKGNKQKRKRDSLNPDAETSSSFRSRYRVKRLKDRSLSTNKDDMSGDVTTKMKLRNEEKGQPTNDKSPIDPDNLKLVLMEEQPKPLLTLMPIEHEGSSEQAETSYGPSRTEPKFTGHILHGKNEHCDPISAVIDHPKEITRGTVLLVSPSGEIYIQCASLNDELYPARLAKLQEETVELEGELELLKKCGDEFKCEMAKVKSLVVSLADGLI